jgi:hypothetical protein
MTTRELLHEIVEKLPESELLTAARILTALEQPADPLLVLLDNAPADDEPFDPADLDGTGEGSSVPHEEVVRSFRK